MKRDYDPPLGHNSCAKPDLSRGQVTHGTAMSWVNTIIFISPEVILAVIIISPATFVTGGI